MDFDIGHVFSTYVCGRATIHLFLIQTGEATVMPVIIITIYNRHSTVLNVGGSGKWWEWGCIKVGDSPLLYG